MGEAGGRPQQGRPWLHHRVSGDEDGMTLYDLLRRLGLGRGLVRRLRQTAGVEVNGEVLRLRERLRAGDEVVLYWQEAPAPATPPAPIPLEVLWEDDHLLVVNKPAGMLVHPVRGERAGTLAGGVVHHLLQRGEGGRPRPVQRLDRGTSGAVVFAKHPDAQKRLSRPGALARTYLAVVTGRPPAASEVDLPVARVPGHPVRHRVDPAGKPARTRLEVLAVSGRASLLAVRPVTGRTHQIRVHLSHLGCPLVGDGLYGEAGVPGRPALHAWRLAFTHPYAGTPLQLEAPLPGDLRALLRELGLGEPG